MPAATAAPRMRSNMGASRVRGPTGVKSHQAEEGKAEGNVGEIEHGCSSGS